MSSQTQQTQQAPQQQAPESQTAQQGPVPEAASFGSENAVEYQEGYGNSAVAGMAGVEGGEQGAAQEGDRDGECMGGELATFDPALASMADAAMARGATAGDGAAGWASVVPDQHVGAVNERVFGLQALNDYLADAVADADQAIKLEGEDSLIQDCCEAVRTLSSKVEIAVELVDAHQQLYQAQELINAEVELQQLALHLTALQGAEALAIEGDVQALKLKAAQDMIVECATAIPEIMAQQWMQTLITMGVDGFSLIMAPFGAAGWTMAAGVALGGSELSGSIDGALGHDPTSMAADLLAVADVTTTTADVARNTLESAKVTKATTVGSLLGPIGLAIIALDGLMEAGAAYHDMYQAVTDAQDALTSLDELTKSAIALRDGALTEAAAIAERLPAGLEMAQLLASSASDTIADLDASHGGGLYNPY